MGAGAQHGVRCCVRRWQNLAMSFSFGISRRDVDEENEVSIPDAHIPVELRPETLDVLELDRNQIHRQPVRSNSS